MRPLTAAEQKAVASLDGLVEGYARGHARRNPSVGYAEFLSAGNLGAVKAVLGWSEDRGPLTTYARAASGVRWRRRERRCGKRGRARACGRKR